MAAAPTETVSFDHRYHPQILENFEEAPIPEVTEPPTRMMVPTCQCKGIIYRHLFPNNVILTMDKSIKKWCPLLIPQIEVAPATNLAPGDPQPEVPHLHTQAQRFINKTDDFCATWRHY